MLIKAYILWLGLFSLKQNHIMFQFDVGVITLSNRHVQWPLAQLGFPQVLSFY